MGDLVEPFGRNLRLGAAGVGRVAAENKVQPGERTVGEKADMAVFPIDDEHDLRVGTRSNPAQLGDQGVEVRADLIVGDLVNGGKKVHAVSSVRPEFVLVDPAEAEAGRMVRVVVPLVMNPVSAPQGSKSLTWTRASSPAPSGEPSRGVCWSRRHSRNCSSLWRPGFTAF